MKIWWPWRQEKPLSLFEKPLSEPTNWPSEGRPRLAPERLIPDQPHAKNAPGPFYVVNTECMTCGYPHVLAPDLIDWDQDSEGHKHHCYFKKQPESPEEVEQAIKAINGSCCGALRYAGADPAIIKRLS
jgi:hypothetical protein